MDQGPSVRKGLDPFRDAPKWNGTRPFPTNFPTSGWTKAHPYGRGFTPSADIYLGLEKGLENRERVLLFNLAPGSKKPDSKAQSGLRKENQYVNTSRIQERNPAYEKKISSLYVYTSPIEPYLDWSEIMDTVNVQT